jgi:hypothetical protein
VAAIKIRMTMKMNIVILFGGVDIDNDDRDECPDHQGKKEIGDWVVKHLVRKVIISGKKSIQNGN